MSDLADFLLARIAEDEAVARSAGGDWRHSWQLSTTISAQDSGRHLGPRGSVEASPARVLAECEAKRRLIALQLQMHAYMLLALPYADHPDYREEWRPAARSVPLWSARAWTSATSGGC